MNFLDIIVFAALAAFLVLRLRSVLGRRTGNERPPRDVFGTKPSPDQANDTVVALPSRVRAEPAAEDVDQADPLAVGLAQIRGIDSAFDPDGFAAGARGAFEMIVASFSAGDRDTLRPLLSDEVFENFNQAITDRAEHKHSLETTLVGIRTAEIIEASMDGRVAFLTVKFVSEQINVTRDEEGEVIDGDASHVATVTDIWTFARNTRSRNPNWTLVATDSQN